MLMQKEHAFVLQIDLQERLAPAIRNIDTVVAQNLWLAGLAKQLAVPVAATAQYPKGLGPTLAPLAALMDDVVEKMYFSAVAEDKLASLPYFSRQQVVLTGTETHVCVLQTAIELRALGKDVFVVAQACGSRTEEDYALGIERMRQAGCVIVSPEMVAFEWLRCAGTETFRDVHRNFIR
jgi:nicotinamidase-related amidase